MTNDSDNKKAVDDYRRTPLNPARMTCKQGIETWGHNVLIGKFHLKGDNPITENGFWPLIQKVRSNEGWCAFVKTGEVFQVASLLNLVTNGTGEVESITVNYVNRWGGISKDSAKQNANSQTLSNPKEFAILLNNMDRTANFDGSKKILDFMDAIYQASVFDTEASRTRMFIKTHFYPTDNQKRRIRENIDAFNMIVYASLGDGKPMELVPWNVESKLPMLKQMWDWQFGLFRRFNGIAFNTSRKEEVHRVAEVELIEEQFESFENIWQQETEYFFRQCYEKFGGEEYNLVKDKESVFRIGDLVERELKIAEKEATKSEEKEAEKLINKNNE
jgi:hypothetical protein